MHVLAPENISLTYRALAQRCEMPRRDVVHMHEIEAGIDKARYAPACRLHNDAPSRGRPYVARPDGGRRVDDHHRQTGALRHVLDHSLGNDLALLIGADRAIFGERTAFVRWR